MNKDIITKVLQEILQADPHYFLPKQFHVLSWKSKRIAGALITKINGQRYLGLPHKDSQGQDYWRYKLLTDSDCSELGNSVLPPNSSDSIAKFQPRPEKTQEVNHGKSNNTVEQSEVN